MRAVRRLSIFALALVCALGCKRHRGRAVAAAPPPGIATELRQRALQTSRAYEILQSLTDEVGPRLAGSPGDAKAVAWALGTMKALGLANVRAEPVDVPHWERGPASAALMAPVAQPLSIVALGGSVATPEGGLEAAVVEVASIEALEALPDADVKGRIVFFDKRMTRTKDGKGYGEAVDVRGKGASAAARKGAVGVLIRSIGTGASRFPHTGALRYDADAPKIPAAALAIPDAELLHRTIARDGVARVRLELGCRDLGEARSANVIGEVVGRDTDEIVLLGAHLDSWDLGTGAVDDGAGVAVVLESARLVAERGERPRRTVRVVLFANEENGLRGAKAYAKAHEGELARHVLALESDLGAGRVFAIEYLAGPGADAAFRALAAPLAGLGVAAPRPHAAHGADLWPLRVAGVPVMELHQDASTYFDVHHTADDTLDRVDRRDLDQVVAVTVAVAWGAADAVTDFGRIPEDARK